MLALSVVALVALQVPFAQADPPIAPVLTSTNPASPNVFSKPFIKGGGEDEATPQAVNPKLAAVGPMAMATKNPTFLITIYADDPTCTDPAAIAAEGTAEELESTTGIQVEDDVKPNWTTTFYAIQTDDKTAEKSGCSTKGLPYRQVSESPDPPIFTSTAPVSGSDVNSPRLFGEADPDATVSIFTNPTCSGAAVGSGTGTTFKDAGIQVSVPDNSTTTFYSEATLAGFSSGCSTSSISYQEITPPPVEEGGGGEGGGEDPPPTEPPTAPNLPAPNPPGKPSPPTLRTTPDGFANNNAPVISGKAPGAASVKIFGSAGCKGPVLLQGSAGELAGGLVVQVPDDTVVTFYGVSIDGGGDRSACSSEPAIYIEDSTAPRTRITGGPGVKTKKKKVVFRFTDTTGDFGTQFICRLDRAKWKHCSAPFRIKRLKPRRHILRVKAFDAAGNSEQQGVKRRFKVLRRR